MKKRCQYIEKCCFFIWIIIIKNKCFLIFPDYRTYVLDIYDIFYCKFAFIVHISLSFWGIKFDGMLLS